MINESIFIIITPFCCISCFLQLPIAVAVFGYEAVKLYREHKRRMFTGNTEAICEATIQWTVSHITFCALCGIIGGCVGGLLGSGGGFVLGPLLLEIGVIPQVGDYQHYLSNPEVFTGFK